MRRGQRRVEVFERGRLEGRAAGAERVKEAAGVLVRREQEQEPRNAFDRIPARVPMIS